MVNTEELLLCNCCENGSWELVQIVPYQLYNCFEQGVRAFERLSTIIPNSCVPLHKAHTYIYIPIAHLYIHLHTLKYLHIHRHNPHTCWTSVQRNKMKLSTKLKIDYFLVIGPILITIECYQEKMTQILSEHFELRDTDTAIPLYKRNDV